MQKVKKTELARQISYFIRTTLKYGKPFKIALSEYKEGHLEEASRIIGHLLNRRMDDGNKRKVKKVLLSLLESKLPKKLIIQ